MSASVDQVARDRVFGLIRASGAQMVDIKFCGVLGRWRHITVPSDQFTDGIFQNGIPFDGSSIPGLTRVESSDLLLIPDAHTSFMDPFAQVPTLSLIADICSAETHEPFARDPRTVAHRAADYLSSLSLADAILMSPEFEFYVFEYVRYRNLPYAASYVVESAEAEWNTYREPAEGYQPTNINPRKGGYHALPPKDTMDGLRTEVCVRLKEAGLGIRYHHHEGGGPGQCEIEILATPLLKAADAVMLTKYFVHMTAHGHGRVATFMPKPIHEESGNGMHVHQHLVKDGKSLFYDPEGWAKLSKTALHYIGGLLEHGPALSAFVNPSTNSYKRLVPGYESPVHLTFGPGDRTAAVRIPATSNPEKSMRIEYRPPDATCNIYFALSAMLMAGLDGIRREIDPLKAGLAPAANGGNGTSSANGLPPTLKDALQALHDDHDFLLQGDVFSREFIEDWIELKTTREINEVARRPHPYEFFLYLDL
ncbi:MAG: type I glutamate--ammonia ligase [Candidatus Eisenbacteria bacterium]|uniref:Type I glutamate--ammonia ligase n=1 Tax=Eiseniibacteriota bacterium TaxID=2212470 RepID=A0A948RRY6_UNCEI|nr:type I glutamate--ammonia ligase [Candidatus Eisenbacteria bacterium]MBU1948493.1 type I glutamate--ammonia ligase [Candidatus Eisenbacteria bacterium]MBU2689885.1 type I glutamate--ammonia ligase [Candidatus Eisenbacteria bacterium]